MKNNFLNIYLSSLIKVVIIGLIIFIASCKATPNNIEPQKTAQVETAIRKKPASSFNDTMIIATNCVIFYSPDSMQLKKIKAVNEKIIFESLTHDCFYQMRNARQVLKKDWPGIKIIEGSKLRWLSFIKKDKSKSYIDLDSKNDICGIIMFNKEKEPVLADMMNIETALNFYFKN
jgi:hypothetical protein